MTAMPTTDATSASEPDASVSTASRACAFASCERHCRTIGALRRECLDRLVVLDEPHLLSVLRE